MEQDDANPNSRHQHRDRQYDEMAFPHSFIRPIAIRLPDQNLTRVKRVTPQLLGVHTVMLVTKERDCDCHIACART